MANIQHNFLKLFIILRRENRMGEEIEIFNPKLGLSCVMDDSAKLRSWWTNPRWNTICGYSKYKWRVSEFDIKNLNCLRLLEINR